MCDICEMLNPPSVGALTPGPAASSASVAEPAAAAVPPTIISRDLSEAAIQICEYVVAANSTNKSGGKRKRASNVGTVTQIQLTDECKKRNSSVSQPYDLTLSVRPSSSFCVLLLC
jgi:hypothetical protein